MKLYRAISHAEYESLQSEGLFQEGPNSMSGKWFAESLEHAHAWGKHMTFDPSYVVVELLLEDDVARDLFRIEFLDGIGPARYAEIDQLTSATILDYHNV